MDGIYHLLVRYPCLEPPNNAILLAIVCDYVEQLSCNIMVLFYRRDLRTSTTGSILDFTRC